MPVCIFLLVHCCFGSFQCLGSYCILFCTRCVMFVIFSIDFGQMERCLDV